METVTGRLTEREQQVLRHLQQAEELGSPLKGYARAFNVNVQELYAGKAQLQRKGRWAVRNADVAKPELLAVRVIEPTVDVAQASCVGWQARAVGCWGVGSAAYTPTVVAFTNPLLLNIVHKK